MMLDDDNYVYHTCTFVKRVKIPEGYTKCPDCNGSGKIIKIWKDPGPNEYTQCFTCDGKGYVKSQSVVNKPKEEK
jgi:DnaJ-class molecular chaperone